MKKRIGNNRENQQNKKLSFSQDQKLAQAATYK